MTGTPTMDMGSYVFNLGLVPTNHLNMKARGAKGNGVTDDTAAITAAIAAAQAAGNGMGIYFPPGNGYKTTGTITVPAGMDVIMDAPIIYSGSANVPALVIGAAATANTFRTLVLDVYRATVSTWLSEDSIGIKLFNCNTSRIAIKRASGFTIGVQCIGSGAGFAHNLTTLGYIVSNKFGIDLTNETSGGIGWCNENLFLAGQFSITSGTNRAISRYGLRITSKDGTYLVNNNNVFLKPSFELNLANMTAGEAVAILIEHGQQNRVLEFRNEGNSTVAAKVQNASSENVLTSGYGFFQRANVTDTSTAPTTFIQDPRRRIFEPSHLIFDSGPMHKSACYADGNTTVHIPRVHRSYGTTRLSARPVTAFGTDYLEIGFYGIGVMINSKTVKRYVVRRDVETGYGGRLYIKCYDAAGNVLTSAGAGHPYVKGASFYTVSYAAGSFGGCYSTGSDSEADFYFEVGADVATVEVILDKGTANLRIRSFQVFAIDAYDAAAWPDYEQVVPGANIGTAAPTAGTWAAGRVVYNAAPAAAGYAGWVCVTGGTPGTWKGFGLIEA